MIFRKVLDVSRKSTEQKNLAAGVGPATQTKVFLRFLLYNFEVSEIRSRILELRHGEAWSLPNIIVVKSIKNYFSLYRKRHTQTTKYFTPNIPKVPKWLTVKSKL